MKMHFRDPKYSDYGACGIQFPNARRTNDTEEVTCLSCKKTIAFKKAARASTARSVDKTIQLSLTIGKSIKENQGFIEIDNILQPKLTVLRELPDNRFIISDQGNSGELYLLTLTLNELDIAE